MAGSYSSPVALGIPLFENGTVGAKVTGPASRQFDSPAMLLLYSECHSIFVLCITSYGIEQWCGSYASNFIRPQAWPRHQSVGVFFFGGCQIHES